MKSRKFTFFFLLSLLLLVTSLVVIAPNGEAQDVKKTDFPVEKPPMYVLQVGISNYKYQNKLSGVTDVLEMRKLLTGDAFKIPVENIRTVCDDGTVKECDGAATKQNIIEEFEKHLINKAREYKQKTNGQAVVVFEFSGHGSQAPDQNGDEKDDHKDETLVTVDSQDAPGKNFDISDDEIYALTKKLSQYTDNIVYILDSCHSGSGTRGAQNVRSVPARAYPVVPVKQMQQTRGETEKKTEPDAEQTDMLPPSNNYVVISAAKAGQFAGQKDIFECDTCPRSRKIASIGYLTFYLIRELQNATANTSYRDIMENVRREVTTEKSSQEPQIEGDDNRLVLKGLSRVKNAGIKISKVENNRIFLEAGAMQGITAGTILDIYSTEDEKIATAKVVESAADKAFAEVIGKPTRAIGTEKKDRAILIAPDLGALRLKVLLDGEDAAKLNDGDRIIIENLRKDFTPVSPVTIEPNGIDLTTGKWNDKTARWDVALLKDRFDKVFPDARRATPIKKDGIRLGFPAADKQIFYLAGKDFVPLYGFYVETERNDAIDRIEKALVQISRLRSVKAIANNKSTLKGLVVIKPFRFKLGEPPCEANGNIKMFEKSFAVLDNASKTYKFEIGEIFALEITNTSNEDLYITVLDIGTDGSVQILSPLPIDPEKQNGVMLPAKTGKKIVLADKCGADNFPPHLRTAAPSGIETFKVIASTAPTKREDFEFLEMSAINGLRNGTKSLTSLAKWTTAEVNFEITAPKK